MEYPGAFALSAGQPFTKIPFQQAIHRPRYRQVLHSHIENFYTSEIADGSALESMNDAMQQC